MRSTARTLHRSILQLLTFSDRQDRTAQRERLLLQLLVHLRAVLLLLLLLLRGVLYWLLRLLLLLHLFPLLSNPAHHEPSH
jgi:hypothetical protein